MKNVLSCIQPTGNMHFGNYFGAVQNWVNLQQTYKCFYGIVDYHAMTMPYNPKKLRENTWNLAFNLLACGVDKENLFIQSMIPEHAELNWILSVCTMVGYPRRTLQIPDAPCAGRSARATVSCWKPARFAERTVFLLRTWPPREALFMF